MKLDIAVNETVLSNVGATGEFKIRNSAKAFKILSDGLYSNKIRAIIRELSCNAVDSHKAAKKEDVPFEVHLPSILEPWFSVRDFGIGLNGDQVVNIYTTYFESTKTESNDFIGALGLGSKSPFSYTENFTVTAIKDGVMRIYSAYINDMGIPCVAEMSVEDTTEQNGVEVKFSVTDRYDYQSFQSEARSVFCWFKTQPKFTGVSNFVVNDIGYEEKDIVPGCHIQSYGNYSYAVMGNIAYPLNNVPQAEKHLGKLASLLSCGLVIEFDIGDLDFAASREELSYVPMTLASIKRRLTELNDSLATHIAKKADAISCEWERAALLQEQARLPIYNSAVKKYVTDTKFELFETDGYYGRKMFTCRFDDLATANLSIRGAACGNGYASKVAEGMDYTGTPTKTIAIPCEMNIVIVLNDLKTGCYERARYHYVNHHTKAVTVYCVSHNNPDLEVRQEAYNKFLKTLHNPPVVVKASELEKKEKVKALTGNGYLTFCKKTTSSYYNRYDESYTWNSDSTFIQNPKAKYYYVAMSNFDVNGKDGKSLNMYNLKAKLDSCGVKSLSEITVIGVRKGVIKEIAGLSNWIHLEDKIKEELSKVTSSTVESAVATNLFDHYSNRLYTNQTVLKLIGADSAYAKFSRMCNDARTSKPSHINGEAVIANLVALCDVYSTKFSLDIIRKKVEDAKVVVKQKYPLLEFVQTAITDTTLADYINLVDKSEKI